MSVMTKKTPTIPVYLRLPKDVKKAIEELAREHRRPFTTEVTIAIEEYLEKHDKWPISG